MFLETSSPRQPGDIAHLVSEVFNPVPSTGRCIQFWYNMYGRAVDILRVIIVPQGKFRYKVVPYSNASEFVLYTHNHT